MDVPMSAPHPRACVVAHTNLQDRTPVIGFLPPPATYGAITKSGENRANQSVRETLIGAFLAGVYIAFGCVLLFTVGGQCTGINATDPGLANIIKGIFGLPYGLTMVIVLGAELTTGNFMYITHALIEGKCTWGQYLSKLSLAWCGNFIGSLFMVLLIKLSAIWDDKPAMRAVMAVSAAKASNTWTMSIVRGILCNWLVCAACTMAMSAQDIVGKIIAVFLPISLFISAGFDHSVANMFIIPMGMAYDNKVDFGQFIGMNLIPVTIGNWIAAVFFVSVPSSLLYGSLWTHIEQHILRGSKLDQTDPSSTALCRDDTNTHTSGGSEMHPMLELPQPPTAGHSTERRKQKQKKKGGSGRGGGGVREDVSVESV